MNGLRLVINININDPTMHSVRLGYGLGVAVRSGYELGLRVRVWPRVPFPSMYITEFIVHFSTLLNGEIPQGISFNHWYTDLINISTLKPMVSMYFNISHHCNIHSSMADDHKSY